MDISKLMVAVLAGLPVSVLLATDATPKEKVPMEPLVIELRLAKDEYKTTETVDAEIRFHNKSKEDLKLPVMEGESMLAFLDFLLIGDRGTEFLTKNSEGWSDPSEKPVSLLRLRAGESHTIKLRNAVPLKGLERSLRKNEQYRLIAIYRDHSYGHSPTYPEYGKNDASVWKGHFPRTDSLIQRVSAGR